MLLASPVLVAPQRCGALFAAAAAQEIAVPAKAEDNSMNLTHRASSSLIGERPRRRFAPIASLALVLLAGHARAVDKTWDSACGGILHFDRELGLRVGGGAGEGESICLVRRRDWQRVLKVCAVEKTCTVRGVIHECPDIPIECSEVNQIFSIRR